MFPILRSDDDRTKVELIPVIEGGCPGGGDAIAIGLPIAADESAFPEMGRAPRDVAGRIMASLGSAVPRAPHYCGNSDCFVRSGPHCAWHTADPFFAHVRWHTETHSRTAMPILLARQV